MKPNNDDFDDRPSVVPLGAAYVTSIQAYGVWIMVDADTRMKCAEFARYPALRRAPVQHVFNVDLVDGSFVWPDLGLEIPFEEIEYP